MKSLKNLVGCVAISVGIGLLGGIFYYLAEKNVKKSVLTGLIIASAWGGGVYFGKEYGEKINEKNYQNK